MAVWGTNGRPEKFLCTILIKNSISKSPYNPRFISHSIIFLNDEHKRYYSTNEPNKCPVKGKIAIITGGARGIGLKIAEQFLKEEAEAVILGDILIQEMEKATFLLNEKFGEHKALFQPTDVSKGSQMEKLFKCTKDRFGRIDLVINNAGILSNQNVEQTINVNIRGLVRGTFLAFQYMSGKGGIVINNAGLEGFQPLYPSPVYCGTNHFVVGFSRSMGHDYFYKHTNVKVMAFCPGPTDTEFLKNIGSNGDNAMFPNMGQQLEKYYNSQPSQPTASVAEGILAMLGDGENGSIWISKACKFYKIKIPGLDKMKPIEKSAKPESENKLSCPKDKPKCDSNKPAKPNDKRSEKPKFQPILRTEKSGKCNECKSDKPTKVKKVQSQQSVKSNKSDKSSKIQFRANRKAEKTGKCSECKTDKKGKSDKINKTKQVQCSKSESKCNKEKPKQIQKSKSEGAITAKDKKPKPQQINKTAKSDNIGKCLQCKSEQNLKTTKSKPQPTIQKSKSKPCQKKEKCAQPIPCKKPPEEKKMDLCQQMKQNVCKQTKKVVETMKKPAEKPYATKEIIKPLKNIIPEDYKLPQNAKPKSMKKAGSEKTEKSKSEQIMKSTKEKVPCDKTGKCKSECTVKPNKPKSAPCKQKASATKPVKKLTIPPQKQRETDKPRPDQKPSSNQNKNKVVSAKSAQKVTDKSKKNRRSKKPIKEPIEYQPRTYKRRGGENAEDEPPKEGMIPVENPCRKFKIRPSKPLPCNKPCDEKPKPDPCKHNQDCSSKKPSTTTKKAASSTQTPIKPPTPVKKDEDCPSRKPKKPVTPTKKESAGPNVQHKPQTRKAGSKLKEESGKKKQSFPNKKPQDNINKMDAAKLTIDLLQEIPTKPIQPVIKPVVNDLMEPKLKPSNATESLDVKSSKENEKVDLEELSPLKKETETTIKPDPDFELPNKIMDKLKSSEADEVETFIIVRPNKKQQPVRKSDTMVSMFKENGKKTVWVPQPSETFVLKISSKPKRRRSSIRIGVDQKNRNKKTFSSKSNPDNSSSSTLAKDSKKSIRPTPCNDSKFPKQFSCPRIKVCVPQPLDKPKDENYKLRLTKLKEETKGGKKIKEIKEGDNQLNNK